MHIQETSQLPSETFWHELPMEISKIQSSFLFFQRTAFHSAHTHHCRPDISMAKRILNGTDVKISLKLDQKGRQRFIFAPSEIIISANKMIIS